MKRLAAGAAVLAAVGGMTVLGSGTGASAATAHCPGHDTGDKVELDYETTWIEVEPGSTVCYKSGTQVFTVVAGWDGIVTSQAVNKHGQVQGISYYVVDDCPPES